VKAKGETRKREDLDHKVKVMVTVAILIGYMHYQGRCDKMCGRTVCLLPNGLTYFFPRHLFACHRHDQKRATIEEKVKTAMSTTDFTDFLRSTILCSCRLDPRSGFRQPQNGYA
jgi:hypothetical protein